MAAQQSDRSRDLREVELYEKLRESNIRMEELNNLRQVHHEKDRRIDAILDNIRNNPDAYDLDDIALVSAAFRDQELHWERLVAESKILKEESDPIANELQEIVDFKKKEKVNKVM